MKVLVTGATGFVGSKLIKKLLQEGDHVIALVRKTSNIKRLKDSSGLQNFEYIETKGVEKIISENSDTDVIVHAATDYGLRQESPISTYWTNVHLPMHLLDMALNYKIPKFVNLDTFFNCSNSNYDYLTSYTLSKRNFQEWGKLISERLPIAFINLRLFHVYGPDDKGHKFVNHLVKKCLAGEDIDLTDGNQKRDFIYIDDVIDAICIAKSTKIASGYHHYDIGSGLGVSIKEFASKVNNVCGNRSQLNFGKLPTRSGEFQNYTANISDIKSLGWFCKTNLDNGLLAMISPLMKKINSTN